MDLWPAHLGQACKFLKIRGAYFYDDIGSTVMIGQHLPEYLWVFTMAHELKHHLVDRNKTISYCGQAHETALVEISAKVFAVALIYPENDFVYDLIQLGVNPSTCIDEDLVRLRIQV